jgi:hypothetical protein
MIRVGLGWALGQFQLFWNTDGAPNDGKGIVNVTVMIGNVPAGDRNMACYILQPDEGCQ